MSKFKLSFVIEKKLRDFLDMPKDSLTESINFLYEQYKNEYKVNQIELRNNSCQKEKYPKTNRKRLYFG